MKTRTSLYPESSTQIMFLEWFMLAYPKLYRFIFHIPNGGQMSIKQRMLRTRLGEKAGVADIFFMHPSNGYNGLWIEFKSEKGRQSDKQKEFEITCGKANYCYALVRSFDDAKKIIEKYVCIV